MDPVSPHRADAPVGAKRGTPCPVDEGAEGVDGVELTVEVSEPAPGRLQVVVHGELDLATTPRLLHAVLGPLAMGAADVTVSLRQVDFIDSTGVVGLLHLRDAIAGHGGRLVLVEPSERVQRVLELTGLQDDFVIEA